MRRRHKKKLWIMGGIGVLTAVFLIPFTKAPFIFSWLYLFFPAIALTLAPIYLRIGKDHTVNIPASIARRHRYMLTAMPVLALLSIVIAAIMIYKYENRDVGFIFVFIFNSNIYFQGIPPILCCVPFVYDMTGRRYPALIIAGTNLLIPFLWSFYLFELGGFSVMLLSLLLPCTSLLFLLLRNKYRFLHWIGLAISGMGFLLYVIAFSGDDFLLATSVICSPLLYALGFWLEGDRAELRPAHTAPSAYPALETYKKRISNTKQKG